MLLCLWRKSAFEKTFRPNIYRFLALYVLCRMYRSMALNSDTPSLRLTGFHPDSSAQMLRQRDAAREVERENRQASHVTRELNEHDARIMFATRVATSLEGGQAAVLRPENRARLRQLANRMGIRDFDASLIVAIVQDAARRGEEHDSPRSRSMIGLLNNAGVSTPRELFWSIAVAILMASVLLMMLVRWATS